MDRVLPSNVDAQIESGSWDMPPIFDWLAKTGGIEESEMRRVFNMGLGMTIVVSDFYAQSIQSQIRDLGVGCFRIGKIVAGSGKVQYV